MKPCLIFTILYLSVSSGYCFHIPVQDLFQDALSAIKDFRILSWISCPLDKYLLAERETCVTFEPDPDNPNGVKGDCGNNMHLELINGTKTVYCDCDRNEVQYLVFHKRSKQCYPLYTQGPCKEDHWVTLEGRRVKCTPNPCLDLPEEPSQKEVDDYDDDDTISQRVLFREECVKLGSDCTVFNGTGTVRFDKSGSLECVPLEAELTHTHGFLGRSCGKNQVKVLGVCVNTNGGMEWDE